MFISQKRCNFAHVIELERHIEILLLSNDCVIVPGLGGFMTHHVEACYDESDHIFLPPLRTLGFNPQLKMNDSLLVQSYVEAYDLSYPEALRRIEDEVTELQQRLENEGSYELNDIGILSLNEDGKIVFAPCEAGILTPDLYGLSSFETKPLKALPEADTDTTVSTPETVETPLFALDDDNDERTIEIKMSWVRNAVAVAAAVLLFVLMTTPISNSSETGQSMGNLNSSLVIGMPKDTNMDKIVIKDTLSSLPIAKTDSMKPVEVHHEAITEKEQKHESYTIVLASYITKKNANIFVEELHQNGFDDAVVFIRNNVTRVVLGDFKTESDAYNKLRTLRGNKHFEEAWVLKLNGRS